MHKVRKGARVRKWWSLWKGQLNDVISEKLILEKEDDQQSNQMMQDIIREIAELKKMVQSSSKE